MQNSLSTLQNTWPGKQSRGFKCIDCPALVQYMNTQKCMSVLSKLSLLILIWLSFTAASAREANQTLRTTTPLQDSGKVVARNGDVIQGLRISNPSGPCVVAQNVTNVTIVNNEIGPCGSDPHYQIGVYINGSSDLQILNNRFQDVSSALYAVNDTRGKLLFEGNYATRIRGPMPRGQLIQLNQYSGPDITIRCNVSDQKIGGYTNSDGKGGPEDHINIYKSSGTENSSIYIVNNKIRGGGSKSGGGILAVDAGEGSNVRIDSNILVDPGQYGIGIPSGSNIQVTNNQIFASTNEWTNVGIYVWNQYQNTACSNNEVSGNSVNYTNKKGASNSYWDSGNCGKVSSPKKNDFSAKHLLASLWDSSFPSCTISLRKR